MVAKGQRGESRVEMLLCAFGTLTAGADARPGPSLCLSLSLDAHGGASRHQARGRPHHTERLCQWRASARPRDDTSIVSKTGAVETPGGPASAPGHPEP